MCRLQPMSLFAKYCYVGSSDARRGGAVTLHRTRGLGLAVACGAHRYYVCSATSDTIDTSQCSRGKKDLCWIGAGHCHMF